MGKGRYNGGSTLIGRGKPWAVEPRPEGEEKRDKKAWFKKAKLLAERNKEMLRAKATNKKRPVKEKQKSDKAMAYEKRVADREREAREKYRDAPKEVCVEVKRGGRLIVRRTVFRS